MKNLFLLPALFLSATVSAQVDNLPNNDVQFINVQQMSNPVQLSGGGNVVSLSNISYSNVSYRGISQVQRALNDRGRDNRGGPNGLGGNDNNLNVQSRGNFAALNVPYISNPSLDNIQIPVDNNKESVQQIASTGSMPIQKAGRTKFSRSREISFASAKAEKPSSSKLASHRQRSHKQKNFSVKFRKFSHRLKGRSGGHYKVSDCFHFAS